MKAHAGGRAMPPERSGSIFVCGDLQVDVGRQRVLQAGRDIELPKLSFDVLLAIVRVAPNVLSIDALMERAWAGIVVNPETVIQRISLLREALGDDSREPRYIGSLRARGYFLIPPVTDEKEAIQTEPAPEPLAPAADGPAPATQVPLGAAVLSAEATDTSTPAEPSTAKRTALLVASLAATVALLGWMFVASRQSAIEPAREVETAVPSIDADTVARTVAVMPFRNLSPDPDDAFLATGLPEMILNRLSKVHNLAVVARSSSFALDPSTGNTQEIGRRLNSAHLVEGNVQRDGDRVRVTAQLIDTSSGTLVWSESFDRRLGDIFAIQDDISNRIAAVLAKRIAELGTAPEPQERSANVTAHLSYFHGLSLLGRYTAAESAAAIPMFERAIALDAGFAAAYASLYDAHMQEAARLHEDMVAARAHWQPLIVKALALNARCGTARFARAMWGGGTDEEREADFKLALALDPSNGRGTTAYGEFLIDIGRDEEGRRMLDLALWIDPLSPRARFRRVMVDMDRLGASGLEQELLKVLEVDPNYYPALQRYGKYRWILHGRLAEAIQIMEQAIAIDPGNPWTRFTASAIYLDLGDEPAARDVAAGSPVSERSSQLLFALYRGDWRRAGMEAYLPPAWAFGLFESWGAPEALHDYALRTGDIDRAAEFMEREYALQPGPGLIVGLDNFREAAMLADLLDAQSRKTEAAQLRSVAAAWNDANEAKWSSLYAKRLRARLWLLAGQRDAALQELAASFRAGDYVQWWYTLERDPAWAAAHGDPRFRTIDADVRAYVAKQRAAVEDLRRHGEIPRRG
jgi:TolB-like protein/DNA-binding winged helix-turn-helix (wHTH) protein